MQKTFYKKIFFLSLIVFGEIFLCAQKNDTLETWLAQAKQKITKRVLANGMTVLFYPLPITSQVDMRITVNTGSGDEREGQYGLAHMVEHMIFKGTQKMSEVDLKLIAEKYGHAESNAYTSTDQTSYFFITDNKHWPIFLSILADSMSNTRFDENHFNSEVKAVISEMNINRAKPIKKALSVALESTFPLNHPYHHAPIGTREDLINATAQDLKSFYREHYRPEQTLLTIVGNLDQEELFESIEKLFNFTNNYSNQEKKHFTPEAFLPIDFIQKNSIIHTQTKKPQVFLHWQTPGTKSKAYPLVSCVGYILNERLKKLKDSHDLVFDIQVTNCPLANASLFFILYEPKIDQVSKILPTVSVSQTCQILIEKELHDLLHDGPTEEELSSFKIIERNQFINSFEDATSIASILGAYCLNNNEYEAFENFDFTQKITSPDIKNFCKRYLAHNLGHTISCVPLLEHEKDSWLDLQEQIDTYEQNLLAKKQRTSPIEQPLLVNQLPEPSTLDFCFEEPDFVTTLSNGLDVYIKHRAHAPTVEIFCGFKKYPELTLYHNLEKKSFIPSMALSQLLEASKNYTKKEHSRFFDSLGASCSFVAQGGSLSCLAKDLAPALHRFFYILRNPLYPEFPFKQEINAYKKNLVINQEDESYRASTALNNYLYQEYPWCYSDSQLLEQLENYTRHDLFTFHDNFIRPDNMAIIIVGDIDPIQTCELLEDIVSTWQPSLSKIPDIQVPAITNPPAQKLTINLPKEQVVLLGGRLTTTKNSHDAYALRLLDNYLNRKLFAIREQTGIFYFCQATLKPDSWLTHGKAVIKTQVSPGNVKRAILEIKQVLKDICQAGIPEEDFIMAQQNYLADLATAFSTNSQLVSGYYSIVANDKSFNHYYTELEKINNLTIEQIQSVAQRYLNPDEWTFVEVGRLTDHATA